MGRYRGGIARILSNPDKTRARDATESLQKRNDFRHPRGTADLRHGRGSSRGDDQLSSGTDHPLTQRQDTRCQYKFSNFTKDIEVKFEEIEDFALMGIISSLDTRLYNPKAFYTTY